MAILSNGKFYGFLCSAKETGQKLANGAKEYVEDFVSGFAGHGWKLWEYVKGKWMLEIDAIRVRGQFTVFEMLVSKVRAIIGAQAITQGCGKIKTVQLSEDGTAYLITLEDKDMSFMEHDFIRCQEFTGSQKVYHVEIESVANGMIRVPLSEFDADDGGMVLNPPAPGDDIVQFGNSSHDEKYMGRHSAIYMHADEGVPPAIDVLDGIYSKDWSDCLKVRMGGYIPGTILNGFYCVNGIIKGVDESGHAVYCLYPDGTAELGSSSALFRPDKSGYIAGGSIAWEWSEEKQKYIVSMDEVQVEWGNVKNTPGWVDEWTKNGTTIGDKFVAAPTGFFGKKDEDTNKLTGILMGKNVMLGGEVRTGMFALNDDETVFELEPETQKCILKGTIYANSGTIGGFNINGYNLSNKDNLDAWININYTDGDSRRVSSLGNSLPGTLGYACSGYFEASGSYDNYALILSARGSGYTAWGGGKTNYALKATGGCDWKMGEDDYWCMPGFLGVIRFNCSFRDNTYYFGIQRKWGNGIPTVNGDFDVKNKVIMINMNMGHTNYYVLGQALGPSAMENLWDLNAHIEYCNSNGFGFSCWNNNNKYIPSNADLFIFGTPSLNVM